MSIMMENVMIARISILIIKFNILITRGQKSSFIMFFKSFNYRAYVSVDSNSSKY